MTEVTREMIHDLAIQIDRSMEESGAELAETAREAKSLNADMAAMGSDIHNICCILGRRDERLEHIERRLELRKLAEPQRPFEPHP